MTKTGLPEFEFPTNKAGEFVPQEELQKNDLETEEQEDARMIRKLSDETKAMPHVIKKVNGEWQIAGMSVESYKEMYSDNDNSAMYKR